MNTKVSRDKYRESLFNDAYKLNAQIETTNIMRSNGEFEKVILKFKHKAKTYGLIEHLVNNLTDYVILEVDGKEKGRYDSFYHAEIDMVELMRK